MKRSKNIVTRLSDDESFYLIDSDKYPRLSTVTPNDNPGLRRWRERVGFEEAERITRETAEWGSKVHLVTAYSDTKRFKLMEKVLKQDDSILPSLLAWQEWVAEFIKEFIAVERLVWSTRLRVAGTLDRAGVLKGDKCLSIVDLKTGTLNEDMGTKIAGYKIMWNEREKRKAERCVVVNLPRKEMGILRVKEYGLPKYDKKFEEACKEYHKMYG